MTSRYSKGFSGSPGRQASLTTIGREQTEPYEDVLANMMDQIVAHDKAFRLGALLLDVLKSLTGQLADMVIFPYHLLSGLCRLRPSVVREGGSQAG